MKYKFFLIVCLLFLLSGCTLNYRLDIDKTGIVEEKNTLIETMDKLGEYTLDIDTYTSNILDEVRNDKKYNSYILYTNQESGNVYGYGSRKYLDFENFKNKSIIVGEMFKKVSLTNNNGLVTILMEPQKTFSYFEDTTLESSLLDEVNIEIEVPYEVKKNNADSVTDNVYVWNIKKGDNLKTINITYDTSQIYIKPISTNVIILGSAGLLVLFAAIYVFIKYKRNGL